MRVFNESNGNPTMIMMMVMMMMAMVMVMIPSTVPTTPAEKLR